jgi:hypothetical protein
LKEVKEMKETLIALVILAYVVPFAYMFIADFVDVFKRMVEIFSVRVKPAVILITKSIID